MMTVFFTFLVMLAIVAVMAIGVLFGRQPIKGSCGGMSALGMKTACDICGGTPENCEKENRGTAGNANSNLAYDATRRNPRSESSR